MPASDWLPAGQVAALEADYGSPTEALLVLLGIPGVGDELYALGVRDLSGFNDPDVGMPPERERVVWRRVAAALLNDDAGEDDEAAGSPVPRSLPPLPNEKQLNSFPHASLEKAVRGFDDDQTRGDVERGATLSPVDARRVRLMWDERLLRLNDKRKLVIDKRVARKGQKYALRYLDESGTRWLDPIEVLKGR